jgi:diguanylate cyclase (GGDEF)-like protein/PAS domain S-box-containing protein
LSAEGESISLLSTLWNSLSDKDNLLTTYIQKKEHIQCIEKMTSEAGADVWQDFMAKTGALTLIAIPLIIGNRCNGLLYICSELSGFSRNSTEGCLLVLLGQYISYNLEIRRTLREQAKSAREEKIYQLLFNSINEGIMITDLQGIIISVNPTLTEITGYTEQELIGKNPRIFQSGVQGKDFYRVMWERIKQYGFWRGEIWNKRKNGEIYPEILNISAIKVGIEQKSSGYVATFSDISEQKKMESQLHQMAFYDHLTGLPNRVLLKESLKSAIFTAKRNQQIIAVLFIDLDHFKNVNDTMGHAAGDILLNEATIRIRSSLRESDILARLGGDEFSVLLQNISSISDVEIIAGKIIQQLSNVMLINGKEVYISASIGISIYPEDGNTFDELLMNADNAMYRAKQQGRGCCQLYNPSMKHYLTRQFELETDLRSAINRNQLVLYFQPQIDITNGEVMGAESLLRWQHPTYGLLSPDQFIPIAEQTGMIISIGKWVLHEACATIKHWQDTSFPVKRLAVNVSAKQFRNDCLVSQIQSILAKTQCNPEFLEIEITESCLLLPKENKLSTHTSHPSCDHLEDIISILHKLKKIGIRISIDDFGTGYSNLSLLKNISIDCLKIDKSFIENIFVKNNDEAIVKTIIAMGMNLNLEIIAEGVEDIQQLQFLIQNQVKIAQGYYFSQPLPKKQFEEFVKNPTWDNQSLIQTE